jgi:hypothetical protein
LRRGDFEAPLAVASFLAQRIGEVGSLSPCSIKSRTHHVIDGAVALLRSRFQERRR